MTRSVENLIVAAEFMERVALSRALTYRVQAEGAFHIDDRIYYLGLAQAQDRVAITQRRVIDALAYLGRHRPD